MAFYFVSTFANAQTPTKQRPYGYRGLKIITSLRLRFPDFQRRLKKSGIAKKYRPIKPERDSAYPTKTEIALGLLKDLNSIHKCITQ
ncbi:hypothetical protein [Bathymodiolus japonicus methanotrophic gill symbiont]|uniref:hypothetical protein n=1 Tax=Bathymodiolus japonicus methanotrophic gill symbiont TaxID=113269 RepID=UPI001C8EE2C4|nr:hypothetical protein [Bathymodiolus japonicus methanotrophic gill symbiont]